MGRRTLEDWQTIIETQQSSSLTIVEYCRENKINPKTFSSRKSVLKQRITRTEKVNKQTDFIQVNVEDQLVGSGITLQTEQVTLHFPSNVSPQWVACLLREMSV